MNSKNNTCVIYRDGNPKGNELLNTRKQYINDDKYVITREPLENLKCYLGKSKKKKKFLGLF
ncbi:MAG: hypothetical protein LBM96_00730 [Methanobrevibacter sp.]|jgi:hypothetical protein|nr:hypothetical protein [Candidatus Methanoflexus mossambicus]